MTDVTQIGQTALKGWRAKVGDLAAGPVSSRTPLDEDQVRAAVGLVFLGLALSYVLTTGAQIVRQLREG